MQRRLDSAAKTAAKKLVEADARTAKARADAEGWSAEASRLTTVVKAHEAVRVARQREIDRLKQEAETAGSVIQVHLKEIADLNLQVRVEESRLAVLEREKIAESAKIGDLEKQVADLGKEVTTLREQVVTEGKRAQEEVAAKAAVVEELRVAVGAREAESAKAADLASQVANLEREKEEEAKDKDDLEAQLAKLAFDNAEYEKYVRSLEVKNTSLTRLVEAAKPRGAPAATPTIAPSAKKPPLIRRSPRAAKE